MTPTEDLDRIASVIDSKHCVAADSLTIGRRTVKSLVSDSRSFRELVAALPKCDAQSCNLVALHEEHGGMCDDFNLRYWCDEHAEGHDVVEADWAPILREVNP